MKFLARLLLLLAFVGVADAQVYTKFGPATGILKGSTSTYQTSAAASSDIVSLWTGTCTGTTNVLAGGGSCVALPAGASSANPTASVGLSIVNGSATTFMRSDAAPALSVAIVPTWTGAHTFANSVAIAPTATAPGLTITETPTIASYGLKIAGINQPTNGDIWIVGGGTPNSSNSTNIEIDRPNSLAGGSGQGPNIFLKDTNANTSSWIQHAGGHLEFYTNSNNGGAQLAMSITGSGSVTPAISGWGPNQGGLVDMTPDSGSNTLTMTGGATSPTAVFAWRRSGGVVCGQLGAMSATSNATTFTITGLPATIQNASATSQVWITVEDNTLATQAQIGITNSGTMTLSKVTAAGGTSASGWTASGTKGIAAATVICWNRQ